MRWLLWIFIVFAVPVMAQSTYVDKRGVWRWKNSGKEVCLFGVNYTAPFAHAYRTAMRLGVDIEKAIDADVYHFARLGFDAFRVHVWDTEISDTAGNLLNNEHLRLFDYLLYRLRERGIKCIITPIAYWGNGWPEPDEDTPGFSRKYGKEKCLEHPAAVRAQQNYLVQFVSHVNPYTKLAYKDDPAILAFEISNEPHHKGTAGQVTDFINGMVKAIRSTGCTKPVFYNVTHSIHLSGAYFKSDIQGGTYQWYPTGLGARHSLQGNLLPHVDRYSVPFTRSAGFSSKTKIVYEFDAADCAGSYIYPAMARSFRTAGMQVATHFAYDPSYMAHINTEYGTHYMNLLYAPHKAIGLMVAAEAFRSVALYREYGNYPDNTRFEGIRVDYETDLAELSTEQKFFYSHSTPSNPVNTRLLNHIAGTGSSPVVQYEGTGAYFLDKIAEGVWRLEVLPDVVWVTDPFGRSSPERTVARLGFFNRQISVHLPDLPGSYYATPLTGSGSAVRASNHRVSVKPGTYLLSAEPAGETLKNRRIGNIGLNEFAAADTSILQAVITRTEVIHQPLPEVSGGKPLRITAQIASANRPAEVTLHYRINNRYGNLNMKPLTGFLHEAEVPAAVMEEGILEYFITVRENARTLTFPDAVSTQPGSWDFYYQQSYRTRVVGTSFPVRLFVADEDYDRVLRVWTPARVIPQPDGLGAWEVQLENIPQRCYYDTLTGRYLYAMRFCFAERAGGRREDVSNKTHLVLRAGTIDRDSLTLRVGLIDAQGNAVWQRVVLHNQLTEHRILLNTFKPGKWILLPRGYPVFLPFWFYPPSGRAFNLAHAENLEWVVEIPAEEVNTSVRWFAGGVWLE
ncbi:MAG: hypothetical protein KatS3mg032_0285 [Cyclobacteriaceae bacterium]|nr:MAG: hypothetical protein KatS3mg032_0285 [Cyclobacteriaceae bacterium]